MDGRPSKTAINTHCSIPGTVIGVTAIFIVPGFPRDFSPVLVGGAPAGFTTYQTKFKALRRPKV